MGNWSARGIMNRLSAFIQQGYGDGASELDKHWAYPFRHYHSSAHEVLGVYDGGSLTCRYLPGNGPRIRTRGADRYQLARWIRKADVYEVR